MYDRNSLNRVKSSKSISTSATIRNRSPSIQLYDPCSPKKLSSCQSNEFIDFNIDSLTTLKRLMTDQQKIIAYYRKWCSDMSLHIKRVFQQISSHISALLAEQQIKMRKMVERQFCTFLERLKEIKNQMKSIYNNKGGFKSEKIVALAQKIDEMQFNQYYAGQKMEARNQFDIENTERHKFKGLNNFYMTNQQLLIELSRKVQFQLKFGCRLSQKKQKLETILRKFNLTIGSSIEAMLQGCQDLVLH